MATDTGLVSMIRRLARRARARSAKRSHPICWASPCSGGVIVMLAEATEMADIRIRVRLGRAQPLDLAATHLVPVSGGVIAFAPLEREVFGEPQRCQLRVSVKGAVWAGTESIGPDRFSGRIEGVRDYALEGWVSPHAPSPSPRVHLLVDGVPGDPCPLDVYRRAFAGAGEPGGWVGFRLILPEAALDGRPHRLGIRAGVTEFDYGSWTAKPRFNIEVARPGRLTGWFLDESSENSTATLNIVTDGVTEKTVKTHFRSDLKAAFGHDAASFVLDGRSVAPGGTLVAGPDGTGLRLGRLGIAPVESERAEARRRLLSLGDPGASLGERRAVRARIMARRASPDAEWMAFEREGSTPARIGVEPEGLRIAAPGLPPVCAIVPVYNGLSDLRLCLASLLPQLRAGRARAIVIDDASTDPAVAVFLADLAARRLAALSVLANPENLGFIATVNRGLALLEPGEDALLVNADTILPPGAVDRLSRHCHARPGVASVTPMSNTATVLSFPSLTLRNGPALGLDVDALDRAFQRHGAEPEVVATGVGFCMHMNGAALREVGALSLDWGRGYCEEVEWCLTARDLGWIHLAATDTFVMHEGSVSFTHAMRLELLATNHARLEALYPEYIFELERFSRADPLAPTRIAVLLDLVKGRFKRLTLHLTHALGGGTKRYIDDLLSLPRAPDHTVGVLTPDEETAGRRVELTFAEWGPSLTVPAGQLDGVLRMLEASGVEILIQVNSRLGFRSTFLSDLLSGARPYVVMLHDFQWYCPRVHLTDGRRFYCGEPSVSVCRMCVAEHLDHDFVDQQTLASTDLDAWLAFNLGVLRRARRLLAPSQDTADRYNRRIRGADVLVMPHPEPSDARSDRASKRPSSGTGGLHVAVIGAIGSHKGFDLLASLMDEAAQERTSLSLTVIGYTADDERLIRYGNVEITGRYEPAQLGGLLTSRHPDLVLLPSVWPETYSYVLSEVWAAGYPVVAFDFGAPAERILAFGGGIVIPPTRDARELLHALTAARARLQGFEPPSFPEQVESLEAYYAPVLTTGEGESRRHPSR